MLVRINGIELIMSPINNRVTPSADVMTEIVRLAKPSDRAEEILMFESPEIASEAADFLHRREVDYEKLELLRISPMASARFKAGALYADYAIHARSGNVYFDLHLVAAFQITATKPVAEPAPALLQLEEHLIGTLSSAQGSVHLIDRQLASLADRVVQAYGCAAAWEY
ncbi:hypothetical protein [Cohnella panacarvi]|uniref:hypothetical protein n=1 Tax=Cohnella panacarvi TaxID=400776 RepID=UPI00047E50BA|nr:hypothetical protein [Cohnella panacarvi]